ARNLALNSRIVLSVEDCERNDRGFQRHLVIHGHAVLERGPDPDLMDRLAYKYLGLARHPLALRDSPTAVVVRVRIDRISGVGPWVDERELATAQPGFGGAVLRGRCATMHRIIRRLGVLGTLAGYFLHPRKGARRRARAMRVVERLAARVGVRSAWLPAARARRVAAR